MINFSKFSNFSYKMFYTMFVLAFAWIFFINVQVDLEIGMIILMVFFIFLAGFVGFKKMINEKKDIELASTILGKIVEVASWLLLFIIISIIGLFLRVTPTWDYGMVHRYSLEWVQQGKIDDLSYFARYPNNNLMLLITAGFYRIIYFFSSTALEETYIRASIILNSFLVTLSICLTSVSAKKMYGNSFKKITVFFLVFFTPIIFYTEIFYTDIIGLIIISSLSYILISKIANFNVKDAILVGTIIGVGFKVKAFILIILVALVIVLFLKNNKLFREKIILILVAVVSFVIVDITLTNGMDKVIGLNEELYEQYQFPTSHWIMMSLNPKEDGGFVQADYEETRDIEGKGNKDRLAKEKRTKRVEELGTKGLINHLLYKKVKRTWSVGSMGVNDYGQRKNVYQSFLHDFMTRNGKYHKYYYILSQSTHLILIFFMLICGGISFFRRNDELNILNITIFGLLLFLIIWECNSRYLFSFIPFFTLSALSVISNTKKEVNIE